MKSIKDIVLEGLVKKANKAKKREREEKSIPDDTKFKNDAETDRAVFNFSRTHNQEKGIKNAKRGLARQRNKFHEAIIEAVDKIQRQKRLDQLKAAAKPKSGSDYFNFKKSGKPNRIQAISDKHRDPELRKTNPVKHKSNVEFSKFVRSKYHKKAKTTEAVDPEERKLKLYRVKKSGDNYAKQAIEKWKTYKDDRSKKNLSSYLTTGHKSTHAKDITTKFTSKKGSERRAIASKNSKLSSKMSKTYRESIITSFIKLLEREDPDWPDFKFDRKAYKDIRRKKMASTTPFKDPTTRKDTLGVLGGYVDKSGKKAKVHGQKASHPWNVRKNKGVVDKEDKPMPLSPGMPRHPAKLKHLPRLSRVMGKPVSVTRMQSSRDRARGKTIHTSRSTGREGDIADRNVSAFNKLLLDISKRKNQN